MRTNESTCMHIITRILRSGVSKRDNKISDRKDFETVIKAMCDYYKNGEVSGKSYGTFAIALAAPSVHASMALFSLLHWLLECGGAGDGGANT